METKPRDYLHFNQINKYGIAALICLILLIFFLIELMPFFIKTEATDFTAFEEEIAQLDASIADKNPVNTSAKKTKEPTAAEVQLFPFNPNTASKETLLKLGLSSKIATTLINYRATGAKFRKKEDLKKIYGLTDVDYSRIAPYASFPKTKKTPILPKSPKPLKKPTPKQLTPFPFDPNLADKTTLLKLGLSPKVVQTALNFRAKGGKFWKKEDFQKIYGVSKKDYEVLAPFINISQSIALKETVIPKNIPQSFTAPSLVKVDVNQANVEEWEKLKGIGNLTAKRLVNFRDKLGGFHSVEQIKSTWNVPDSVIDKVADQLVISPIIDKISINTITPEALKLHPYVKTRQAYIIVNHRVNHGNYNSIEDLRSIKAFDDFFINRLAPYLSFEVLEPQESQ